MVIKCWLTILFLGVSWFFVNSEYLSLVQTVTGKESLPFCGLSVNSADCFPCCTGTFYFQAVPSLGCCEPNLDPLQNQWYSSPLSHLPGPFKTVFEYYACMSPPHSMTSYIINFSISFCSCCFVFGSHYAVLAGLELADQAGNELPVISLPLLPEC